MTENASKKPDYSYKGYASLVLKPDRSEAPRRDKEVPEAEIQSLYGRIDPLEMGSRVLHEKPPTLDIKPKSFSSKKAIRDYMANDIGESTIYTPKTETTKTMFELLFTYVYQHYLTEATPDVVLDAIQEIILIIKNDSGSMKDTDKKEDIENLLSGFKGHVTVNLEEYSQLVNLVKKLSDFKPIEEKISTEETLYHKADEEEYGVAVVFDEDEEDMGITEEMTFEIADAISEESPEEISEKLQIIQEESTERSSQYYISMSDIDVYWIQRQVGKYIPDPQDAHSVSQKIEELLESSLFEMTDMEPEDIERGLENRLVDLLDYEKFDLVKLLVVNRTKIIYGMKLSKSDEDQKESILKEIMSLSNGQALLSELYNKETAKPNLIIPLEAMQVEDSLIPVVDLEKLAFKWGSHTMTNKRVELPAQSWKKSHKGYEEIYVPPAITTVSSDPLLKISELPEWAQSAFAGFSTLNRIQSKVAESALNSTENLLVCAPTGAGKTNIAMLAVLRVLGDYGLLDQLSLDPSALQKDHFKIVYIAPMKALVQEMVQSFKRRLEPFGVSVEELSGDRQLSRAQIQSTQMIVTTPEKWDVISRKSNDTSYSRLVRLMIIDEIHLLHDERGPVLEAIISRTLRQADVYQDPIRLVGLSATLPNYLDVAKFLNVQIERGLFYFDASFRPCPLEQYYYGLSEKKPLKRYTLMNELVYQKVIERAGKVQMIIFVHTRKDTAKTARFIRDNAVSQKVHGSFFRMDSAMTKQILQEKSDNATHPDLQDLLPLGFAIHHAGMTRPDRDLVESLFEQGHIQVLVSTATLAWGVNLPAHTVIIKGTQVYSPEKGSWVELSPQDILQMFGRAGRPQYDSSGEGLLITSSTELQYYMSLLNMQLPIESQLISKLSDHLNAEISLNSIHSRQEALEWLERSYLWIRLCQAPSTYGVLLPENLKTSVNSVQYVQYLKQTLLSWIHSAALVLEKAQLISYEKRLGIFQPTEFGKISSYYYIQPQSMSVYLNQLKPHYSEMDIFRIFSLSSEFKNIPVRQEEILELSKLIELVPIPIKDAANTPLAKMNILLQAYISGLKLEGYALSTDLVYITQSATRIMRGLFEIALKKEWPSLAMRCLDLSKVIERKCWSSLTPLRQLRPLQMTSYSSTGEPLMNHGTIVTQSIASTLSMEILKRFEKKDLPFVRLLELNPADLSELLRLSSLPNTAQSHKLAKTLHVLLHSLPRIELSAEILPLTRHLLSVSCKLTPHFIYDPVLLGSNSQIFWIFVTDSDEEKLLYSSSFLVKQKHCSFSSSYFLQEAHSSNPDLKVSSLEQGSIQMSFSLPILHPCPPAYFIHIVSDKWLNCQVTLPISFKNLVLPQAPMTPTHVLDLSPVKWNSESLSMDGFFDHCDSESALLAFDIFKTHLWSNDHVLNKIQTQVIRSVWPKSVQKENMILESKPGTGSLLLVETAILYSILHHPTQKVIITAGNFTFLDYFYNKCKPVLESVCQALKQDSSSVVLQSGYDKNIASFVSSIDHHRFVFTHTKPLEILTRKYKQRTSLHNASMVLLLDIHQMGSVYPESILSLNGVSSTGVDLELLLSRLRMMNDDLGEQAPRLMLFGSPTHQTKDIADWVGISPVHTFHFSPHVNTHPQPPIQLSVIPSTTVLSVSRSWQSHTALLIPLLSKCDLSQSTIIWLPCKQSVLSIMAELSSEAVVSFDQIPPSLLPFRLFLERGIAPIFEMSMESYGWIAAQFNAGCLKLLCVDKTCLYSSYFLWDCIAIPYHIKVFSTAHIGMDGHLREDSLADMFELIGKNAALSVCLFVLRSQLDYWQKGLDSSICLESDLVSHLIDVLTLEMVNSPSMRTKQDMMDWLSWTFYYRRLVANPNYYHLSGSTAEILSDGLSDLLEQSCQSMLDAKLISTQDDDSYDLGNLSMICAYYSLYYESVEMMANSITVQTKAKGLLEIVASCLEMESLSCRREERRLLAALYTKVPFKLASVPEGSSTSTLERFMDPHVKIHTLLQLYLTQGPALNRLITLENWSDLYWCISGPLLTCLYGALDVSASASLANPVLAALDLAQMISTGTLVDLDYSFLRQFPCLRDLDQHDLSSLGVDSPFDLLDDNLNTCKMALTRIINAKDERDRPYLLNQAELLYNQLSRFPNLEVISLSIQTDHQKIHLALENAIPIDIKPTEDMTLSYTLQRPCTSVSILPIDRSYLFSKPLYKEEQWWIILLGIVGKSKHLLAVKRTPIVWIEQEGHLTLNGTLSLILPESKEITLKVLLVTDAWIGADQEYQMDLVIRE